MSGTAVRWATVGLAGLLVCGCAGRLANRPELYRAEKTPITKQNVTLHPVLVKPVVPGASPVFVLFASGDGGLTGVSKKVLQHLADRGYYVAGFSSREVLQTRNADKVPYAEAMNTLAWMTSEAKSQLRVPADAPTVVTGVSRGANMVILAATAKAMQKDIKGAVAIALTRELDNLSLPEAALAQPGVKVDAEGRPQTYPAIERMGAIPLAVIQSTRDSYVTSAESRKLLGPDSATRRLFEVPSKGHSFGGGEKVLLDDLDQAMDWILSKR